jgi:hypothetical protein
VQPICILTFRFLCLPWPKIFTVLPFETTMIWCCVAPNLKNLTGRCLTEMRRTSKNTDTNTNCTRPEKFIKKRKCSNNVFSTPRCEIALGNCNITKQFVQAIADVTCTSQEEISPGAGTLWLCQKTPKTHTCTNYAIERRYIFTKNIIPNGCSCLKELLAMVVLRFTEPLMYLLPRILCKKSMAQHTRPELRPYIKTVTTKRSILPEGNQKR